MRLSRASVLLVTFCGALLAGCAARLPVVTTPAYPSYPVPIVPAELIGTPLASEHDRAWLFLQAGDLEVAEDGFGAILTSNPAFYPSHTGLGFVFLADGHLNASVRQFDEALQRAPTYVPALLGRADALLLVDRVDEAIEDLSAALEADPSLITLRERIAELEFTGLMAQVALARAASEAGRNQEARDAYERIIALSPDSGFLYLELAQVEQRQGDSEGALERLEHAVSLDPSAVDAWILMADIYFDDGDFDRAEQALFRADAIGSGADIKERLAELEARRRTASLPPEYSDIETVEMLTRGQLAALIGVRFAALLAAVVNQPAAIITDARGHWAYGWIVAVSQDGLMEADVNYRFQPDDVVTRMEMALVMVRILRLAEVEPTLGERSDFPDLATGHLGYPAAAETVAIGLLLLEGGSFQPERPVRGVEAIAALVRLGAVVEGGR